MNFAKTNIFTWRTFNSVIHLVGASSTIGMDRCGCLFAAGYATHHHITHATPIAPAAKNTTRQLLARRIAPINGGARTAPTDVPALINPMALERLAIGTHSATTRVAAGNPPP